MERLAFTHPGKMGDALYSLPTMRLMCKIEQTTCDFYTSEYCRPMKRLVEYQSFVDGFYIPDSYKVERMDMGVQPWRIPVDGSLYSTVWQLGFRSVPDKPLPYFIAQYVGINRPNMLEIKYEYDKKTPVLDMPYIVMAARGDTSYKPMFLEIIDKLPIPVVEIGGVNEAIAPGHKNTVDMTGLDMLETTAWIANSMGFVGMMSAMLVLANGFNIPKVSPHDNIHWDMRHVVYGANNFYPVNPTATEVIGMLGIK